MTKIKNMFKKYLSEESGLVTIEWVGIAAVVVLAGIIITTFMMTSARDLGDASADQMDAVTANIAATPAPSAGDFNRP